MTRSWLGDRSGRVVILTALEVEYAAVRTHLRGLRPVVHPSGTIFEVGTAAGSAQQVALAVTGEGSQNSAVLTERAAALFDPAYLLFVGVAGALHDDLDLGDVIVATRVYAYHGGDESGDGFTARPRAWDAPHYLEQWARQVSRTRRWRARPPSTAGRPAVRFRPAAAGEVVVAAADAPTKAIIRRHYSDAAIVEMEGAGVARAAYLNNALPALVIRGVSDRADPGKLSFDRAGSQALAAANAAAFAIDLVRHVPDASPRSSRRQLGRWLHPQYRR
jgi:nucleoside phosphorylase